MTALPDPVGDDGRDPGAAARATPHGTLYRPRRGGRAALAFAGALLAGPAAGWALATAFSAASDLARAAYVAPFVVTFALGYAWWLAHLQALAAAWLGPGLLRALWSLFVRRRAPDRGLLEGLLDERRLTALAVAAQRASWTFLAAGVLAAAGGGAIVAFASGTPGPLARGLATAAACLAYAAALHRLGRRGYLPLPEE